MAGVVGGGGEASGALFGAQLLGGFHVGEKLGAQRLNRLGVEGIAATLGAFADGRIIEATLARRQRLRMPGHQIGPQAARLSTEIVTLGADLRREALEGDERDAISGCALFIAHAPNIAHLFLPVKRYTGLKPLKRVKP